MNSSRKNETPSYLLPSFFEEKDALQCAKALLGKKLVTCITGKHCSALITETEAYCAPEDKASHAYNYRKTARTQTMYEKGGTAYVYLCYGIHQLFNVVCGPEGMPHAVLIRALQPISGIEIMMKRRKMEKAGFRLSSGPGTLSQAMGIDLSLNGHLLSPENGIWIEDTSANIEEEEIVSTTRIGIDYAGEWASKPWRFYLKDSQWISKK